ncbi:hypothetical protein [Mycobacterium asiaticum]|uniref:hypothetical protein n=1 Tax=Mycobacterium asiaticum TaxID=1790 RepID=UPI0012DB63B5|nr:hypothetical protein [Mycobacterium asiaticum]
MSPTEAVNTCENALRDLLAHVYRAKWGDGWIEKISTAEQRAKWAEKAELQEKRKVRRGVVTVAPAGLAYSYLYELLAFAEKHWEPLAEALGPKKEIMPLLYRFEELRDLAAHGHQLRLFEQEFMSGVAGLIRNKVTIFMSTLDPAGDLYPRIELVSDEFGNEARVTLDMQLGGICNTNLVLKVGQQVTFTCTGTDPQDRRLHWSLMSAFQQIAATEAASGEVVRLTWTVDKKHVKEDQSIWISLKSSGEYHRYGAHDHRVAFTYTVRP